MGAVHLRLSILTFLQYAIWGAWLPILWLFLQGTRGLQPDQIGTIFSAGAIGALLAPFVAGQIADRWFPTEYFLGVSHLLGAVLMWQLASVETFAGFLWFSVLYSLIYAPTLSLSNSITLHHVADRDRDFGKIRVWGTIGWIVAGIAVGQWLAWKHTPDEQLAADSVIENRVFDRAQRARLLNDYTVTLNNGDTYVGRVQESSRDTLTVTSTEDGSEESDTFSAREVRATEPLYATLAARGKAEMLFESLRRLERSDDEATRSDVKRELLQSAIFKDETLRQPILEAQNAGRADAFRLSAILGVVLGLFCMFLPHTPPQRGERHFAVAAAMQRIRVQPLLTLFVLAVPVSCIHQFYFVHTSGFLSESSLTLKNEALIKLFGVGGGGLMTLGQVSEIVVLALLPMLARRLSRRSLLAIGLFAYGMRMMLFAYAGAIEAELGIPQVVSILTGIALHGLCFGCFIFVAFLIVDEQTTGDVRATAQSLFNFVIVGIGIIVGSKIASSMFEAVTIQGRTNWTRLFELPMWGAFLCLALLYLLYPRKAVDRELR